MMVSSDIKKSLFGAGTALLMLTAAAAAPAPPEKQRAVGQLPEGRKKISIRQEYLVLGELLELLTLQSGVRLALHKNDEWASGIPITASIHDRELPMVLRALEDLFTHRFNSAEWRPAGEDRKGYVLRFGRNAEMAANVVLQDLLEEMKRETRELYRLSLLPASAREAQQTRNPILSIPSRLNDPKINLLPGLSAAELEMALSGTQVQIPWERLTPAGRAASNLGLTYAGEPRDAPRPGPISFQMKLREDCLTPVFWVTNVERRGSNLVGGPLHDEPWLRRNAGGWMTPGDPEARGVVEGLKKPDDESKPLPARTVPRWLMTMTDRYNRDFIAEYAHPVNGTHGSVVELRDWKRTLGIAVFRLRLMAQDDGPILLLRTAQSLVSRRRDTVPWSLTRQLRASVAADNGFLSLDALTSLSELSLEQVATCNLEFGGIDGQIWPHLLPLLLFRDRLLPAWRKQLSKPEGLPLRDSGVVARLHLLSGEDPDNVRGLKFMQPEWGRLAARLWIEDMPQPRPIPGRPVRPQRRVKWALYHLDDRSTPVHQWSTVLYQHRDRSTVHERPLQPRERRPAIAQE